jgi:hypothetical protein
LSWKYNITGSYSSDREISSSQGCYIKITDVLDMTLYSLVNTHKYLTENGYLSFIMEE